MPSSAPAPASEGALPTVSGSGPGEWNDSLVAGIAQVCAGSDLRGDDMGAAAKRARAGLAAMNGIGPGDVIADLLSAQLVSAHHAAMDCYKRAAGGELPLEVWREALNQANRLSRTSAALIEALNRHRGKSGQQTVRVEHVTVNDGGQAIVRRRRATGGGGDDPGNVEQPHARGPPVRRSHAERDAMPRPGDAEWPMPDARWTLARRSARQPPCVEARRLHSRGHRATPRGRRADPHHACSHAPARDVNRGERRQWKNS